MRTIKLIVLIYISIIFLAFPSICLAVNNSINSMATKEYKVAGRLVWAEAKKKGYKFYPENHQQGVKDGVDDWGSVSIKNLKMHRQDVHLMHPRAYTPAHIIAGTNLFLYPCLDTYNKSVNCTSNYKMFFGKPLKAGWAIKQLIFTGAYSWTAKKYRVNTNKISTVVKLSNPKSRTTTTRARLKGVILIGPKDGKWQDAFDVL